VRPGATIEEKHVVAESGISRLLDTMGRMGKNTEIISALGDH